MIQFSDSNRLSLAVDFILNTSCSIFLTGKAGTGKTTLLKHIRETTKKRCVIVAPTGVAAINAGGVTIHSFLSIPPYGPFLPVNRNELPPGNVMDRRRLFQHVRLSEEKRDLINDLELMIIDEVSMVRADLLDVIDVVLRTFRKKQHLPFGGVQVVFIGDLLQLPPVVKNDDWPILQEFYASPYFFDARVLADSPPIYIELNKVFRQRDQRFIDILNHIRNNETDDEDHQMLEHRFDPTFMPAVGDDYITLTTHNYKADAINQSELGKLRSELVVINGKIEGDFPESALPAEMKLQLKVGAQVMFLRNDSEEEPRYFNGKLAIVSRIEGEDVYVTFRDGKELKVVREIWRNVRYSYDRDKESIQQEELGSYVQLPLRLAWAITIHKSQGLTFEKAILDVGDSFATGQVYVALSRCTSMDGMVLKSRIPLHAMQNDPRVVAFASRQNDDEVLQMMLEQERKQYQIQALTNAFDFTKLPRVMENFLNFLPGKKITDYKGALDMGEALAGAARRIVDVAARFQNQLAQLIARADEGDGTQNLKERVRKAIEYFVRELADNMLPPLDAVMDKKAPKTKKFVMELRSIKSAIVKRIQQLQSIHIGGECMSEGIQFPDIATIEKELSRPIRGERVPKGVSQQATLEMHQRGMSIAEIAEARNLATSTIMGHLAEFVSSGLVPIEAIVEDQKLARISKVLDEMDGETIAVIRGRLGNDFSYTEIKAVVGHKALLKSKPMKVI